LATFVVVKQAVLDLVLQYSGQLKQPGCSNTDWSQPDHLQWRVPGSNSKLLGDCYSGPRPNKWIC